MLESEMPHGAGSEAIGLVNRRSSTRGRQRQLLAQRRGPGGAGSLLELDEEPTYRWGGRLSKDDP